MAPRPDLITELGWQKLGELPTLMRDDPDVRAFIHCDARETERQLAQLDAVRAELNPATATAVGMPIWETLVRLPIDLAGAIEARRDAVLRRIRTLVSDPSGREWQNRLSAKIGTGWTYEEHIPGDPSSPPSQTLRLHLVPPALDPAFDQQKLIAREETPSELALVFVSAGGFRLDESEMDQEAFGG